MYKKNYKEKEKDKKDLNTYNSLYKMADKQK
jgi:hypothetical protein